MDEKQVERVEVETLELEKKPGKNKQKRKLTMPKKKTVMLRCTIHLQRQKKTDWNCWRQTQVKYVQEHTIWF